MSLLTVDSSGLTGATINASNTIAAQKSVQQFLEDLDEIVGPEDIVRPGDLRVTGGPLPNSSFDIEFDYQYAEIDIPEITIDDANLTFPATGMPGTSFISELRAARLSVGTALRRLLNIDGDLTAPAPSVGDIVVTGGALPVNVDVEFVGQFAGQNIGELTVDNLGFLTGAASVTNIVEGTLSIRQALEGLSSLVTSDFLLTGGPLPSDVTITFQNRWGNMDLDAIVPLNADMTNGSLAVITELPPTGNSEIQTGLGSLKDIAFSAAGLQSVASDDEPIR